MLMTMFTCSAGGDVALNVRIWGFLYSGNLIAGLTHSWRWGEEGREDRQRDIWCMTRTGFLLVRRGGGEEVAI
jgi:hypothetical protein